MDAKKHQVIVIGGGFGGLKAVQSLRRADANVTLIDRRNFHLFQPLLYQVATGGLSPANIASPLREILRRQKNIEIVLGEVIDIDPAARTVALADQTISYDSLIVAAGARSSYFGNPTWEANAPGLKSIEDATEIRAKLLSAFEKAEQAKTADDIRRLLTFVVIGGGPTGVELAGAMAEVARDTLRNQFRHIDPRDARIYLIEASPALLAAFPKKLQDRAVADLERLGVTVRTGCAVTGIHGDRLTIRTKQIPAGDSTAAESHEETIDTHTVCWAAGVQAAPLSKMIAERFGVPLDRAGRVVVDEHCNIPGHGSVFVIGDMANFTHGTERPLPGVAPVAMQQGIHAAKRIIAQIAGKSIDKPFKYHDKGSLATIGRAKAVADLGRLQFGGYLAWLAWLFIHLMLLVGFQNRLLVLMQWFWNYVTHNRSARLITGEYAIQVAAPLEPLPEDPRENRGPTHNAKG